MQILAAYVSSLDDFILKWLKKYSGASLLLIPEEMAKSLSPTLARRISLGRLSTFQILTTIFSLNKSGDLDLKNISFVADPFFLVPIVMPDDPFHRKFAERYYGKTFGHMVKFENIWIRDSEFLNETNGESRELHIVRAQ